jgi:hypothetical protein
MLPDRSYGPETIAVMSVAIDKACQFISKDGSVDDKKTLALIILRLVDQGECDPERLAETAFREWTGVDLLRRRFRSGRTLEHFDEAIEELKVRPADQNPPPERQCGRCLSFCICDQAHPAAHIFLCTRARIFGSALGTLAAAARGLVGLLFFRSGCGWMALGTNAPLGFLWDVPNSGQLPDVRGAQFSLGAMTKRNPTSLPFHQKARRRYASVRRRCESQSA